MSLQFILGNSGSGKTESTYRAIVKEAGENPFTDYLIIVPEQFTLQTQQKLVELAPNHAIMNIDVLSFKRLAYRVFDELGMNTTEILEETGKNLVLRKVAEEHGKELTILGANMNRLGYISEVKSLISELMQYNVAPEQLEAYRNQAEVSGSFAEKLGDIITMYRGFKDFLQDRYITAEELLQLLIPAADRSSILKNSVIVLDEFTGFTPVQNQLLYKLLQIASRIYVLLSFDAKEDADSPAKEHELFAMTKKTMQQLRGMAEELSVTVEKPVICSGSEKRRFSEAPDLAHLEQNLFRPWIRKWKGPAAHLTLSSCQNPKEEMLYAVRRIKELVREEGYRYRDIALVTGAVDKYGCYVEDLFAQYDIPYFLDQTRDIVFHPFIECLRAIPEVIIEDFSYPSVMRFLRSGFSGFTEEEGDRLDNYLIAVGGKGLSFWRKKWLRLPRAAEKYDLEQLEELRLRFMAVFAPLLDLPKTLRTGLLIEAYYQVICSLKMEEKLFLLEDEALLAGEQIKAKEYSQLYRIVMELLEKYHDLLEYDRTDMEEFAELLDAGFSAAKVAAIPPGFDCVTIGDIERTRLNHVKVLFFVGVNDGIIPKSTAEGGIISEFERELMQEASIELAPGAREQTFIQRFYLYRNLTKPSSYLYLSWSRTDAEGKALRPSYLVDTLQQLFPEVHPGHISDLIAVLSTATPEAAKDYLVRGERDEDWYALAASILRNGDDRQKDRTMQLLAAQFIEGSVDPISRVIADALYGHSLDISVTRIEKFAACAYAHFLRYGLRLQEREESGFENVDIGNLYHDALRNYGFLLQAAQLTWTGISEEERNSNASKAFQQAILEYPSLSAFATASDQRRTERMDRIFRQTVWALTEQLRAGSFVPAEYELSFEEIHDKKTLQMILDREHVMNLYGRIDRVDLCDADRGVMVKVIDYKSGSQKFDLIRVYQGRMLQLVVYADTAMAYAAGRNPDRQISTGAILYYNIDDPIIKLESGEEISEEELKAAVLKELKPDGLVNSEPDVVEALDHGLQGASSVIPVALKNDGGFNMRSSHIASEEEFEVLRDYVRGFLEESGRKIYEGDIRINPYKDEKQGSCTYCPYSGVCAIHAGLPGTEERPLPQIGKEEVLDRMRTINALRKEEE